MIKTLATLVLATTLEVLWAADCRAQVLPEPTGAYPVGRVTFQFLAAAPSIDQEAPKGQKRQFKVQVWYPAKSGVEDKTAPWLPAESVRLEVKGYLGMLLKVSHAPEAKDIPKVQTSVVVKAREEIPLADSPSRFPVIVFSAGSQTIPSTYSALVEELASRGFVVVGYGPTVIGRGTWKGDLGQLLDQLSVWDSTQGHRFFGRLDLEHIGAFGHSAGGNAISAIAASERRFKAIVLIDPGMVNPEDGPLIPTLILKSEDVVFQRRNPEVAEEKAKTRDEYVRKAKPGLQITLLGSQHLSFTDLAVMPAFALPGDGKAFIETTRAVIGGFFGRYLSGKPSELIEEGSGKYPLARIDTPHK